MGEFIAVFYKDGIQYDSFWVQCVFPVFSIKPFQVAILYYHFDDTGFGFTTILDEIELTNKYFLVGTRYIAMENLRLRSRGSLSSKIIRVIERDEWVTVLEEGNEETIDDLTSIWVKVRLTDNTEGWCFGGYLGLDFLRRNKE